MAIRVSRRRRRAHRVRRAPGALIVLAVSLAVCGLVAARMHRLRADVERSAREPAVAAAPVPLASATARAVYPYSIIRGGAYSTAELHHAIETDPVVRDHYEGFDLSRTRVVRLAQARAAHVSYRRGPHVFWTAKKVVIPAGELVLTDGTRWARTRCGNQIADTPGATSVFEPSLDEIDTPHPGLQLPDVPGIGLRTIADGGPGPRPTVMPNDPGGPGPGRSTRRPGPTSGPTSSPTSVVDPDTPGPPPALSGHASGGDPPLDPGGGTPDGEPDPHSGGDTADPPRVGGPVTSVWPPPPAAPVPPSTAGGPPPFTLPPVTVPRIVLTSHNPDGDVTDSRTPDGTVPEPGSAALLLASLAAAAARDRRRSRRLRHAAMPATPD